jgi:hypothetical protein
VLWIRIQSYRTGKFFAGSGRTGIILPNPDSHQGFADPNPYPFQLNAKLKYNFFQNISPGLRNADPDSYPD